jgi:2-aminoethylphosphonate-pyruvate transaminase
MGPGSTEGAAGIPPARDKLLFTPGPLTTSRSVKLAMLRDLGSRDAEFLAVVREVRERLLAVAGVSKEAGWEAILLQGSGTYAVEAVISSCVPARGKLLVAINGAYGERIAAIAAAHRIEARALRFPEEGPVAADALADALERDRAITHVAAVHCETTSGVVNPVEAIGALAARHGRAFIVDSMSGFGALPVDLDGCRIDYLVASPNKGLEGVPGFAFVLARRSALERIDGHARTLSLDLLAQWRGLEENGQFRFTPPTHAILAAREALSELEAEGGVAGRARRYRENHARLRAGMEELGFRSQVPREHAGWVISSFHAPAHPRFVFEEFYARLSARGYLIYPGKVSSADCFRIGNIGRLFPADVDALLAAIRAVLGELRIDVPLRS